MFVFVCFIHCRWRKLISTSIINPNVVISLHSNLCTHFWEMFSTKHCHQMSDSSLFYSVESSGALTLSLGGPYIKHTVCHNPKASTYCIVLLWYKKWYWIWNALNWLTSCVKCHSTHHAWIIKKIYIIMDPIYSKSNFTSQKVDES